MTKQRIPKLTKKKRSPAAQSLAAALHWDKVAAQGAELAAGADQAAGDQAAQVPPAQGAAGDQAASAGAQTTPSPPKEHTPC